MRGQKDLSVSFGQELRSGRSVFTHYLTTKEEEQAWQIYKKFRDHPLSFTDCTTLFILREQHLELLSFDEDLLKIAKGL